MLRCSFPLFFPPLRESADPWLKPFWAQAILAQAVVVVFCCLVVVVLVWFVMAAEFGHGTWFFMVAERYEMFAIILSGCLWLRVSLVPSGVRGLARCRQVWSLRRARALKSYGVPKLGLQRRLEKYF